MNTLKIETYNVITLDNRDLLDTNGGGFLRDAAYWVGYAVGYAAGAVKDFITSGDPKGSEVLMNCI